MHVAIVGPVGGGKTVLAQLIIDRLLQRDRDKSVLPHERVYSLTPVTSLSGVPVTVLDRDNWFTHSRCGLLFIDEIHRFLWSRAFASVTPAVIEFLTMHRHDDCNIVSTTQHIAFLDKALRILTDKIIVVELHTIPLLGFFVPSSVRPPHTCKHGPHARRDARGDHHGRWASFFRCGTILRWYEYDPVKLLDVQTTNVDSLADMGIDPIETDWCFWPQPAADAAQGLAV